jgi:hypothetical protein
VNFRDAQQSTGLADCQAHAPQALDTHVNASLTALNLAKAALLQQQTIPKTASFSIAFYKRAALNAHLLDFISMFNLNQT